MSPPAFQLVPSRQPHARSADFERVTILGVDVGVLTRHRLTSLLRECLDSGVKGWISYVNVHAINISQNQPWFRLFLNESLVTYCDGQGVRMGATLLGKSIPERIVMSDWIYDICELAVLREASVFLLGSTSENLEAAVDVLQHLYPGIEIVGYHDGYISTIDREPLIQRINKTNPDLLIVGMGMPQQEEWILKYHDRLNARILLNAGSCFDYVAGAKKRCPAWMGIMGLEWLYRLAQEPRRLWKRYLIGNPLFLIRVVRSLLRPYRINKNVLPSDLL